MALMKLVQCWDDGVHDDIRVADILRNHGATASFNLNLATQPATRSTGWKRGEKEIFKLGKDELLSVYDGFLVANHTAHHPRLTQLTPEEAAREINQGREELEQMFGYAVTGFAYPFGDYNEAVMELVAQSGAVYARTCVNVAHCFPPENPMAFHSNSHFLNPEFWPRFEASLAADDAVFYFWGHSYEIITEEDWKKFDAQISRLSATPGTEWANLPDLFA